MNQIKQCLVTGAAGFIGEHLCKFLQKRNICIRALQHQTIPKNCNEIVSVDLEHIETITSQSKAIFSNIDTIFHLANAKYDPYVALEQANANLQFDKYLANLSTIIKLAVNYQVKRFIYFSSVKAINPHGNPYGELKQAAEYLILKLGKQYPIDVSILQPALVYHPPKFHGRLLIIYNLAKIKWLNLNTKSNASLSIVAMENLLTATWLVATNPIAKNKIYQITDNKPYKIIEIYKDMRKYYGMTRSQFNQPKWILKIIAKFFDFYYNLFNKKIYYNSAILDKFLHDETYSSKLVKKELNYNGVIDFNEVLPYFF